MSKRDDAVRAVFQKMWPGQCDDVIIISGIRAALRPFFDEEEVEDQVDNYTDENIAQLFHETYERLAPEYGYKTRKESAVDWHQVPEQNRKLMIDVAGSVRAFLTDPKPKLAIEQAAKELGLEIFSDLLEQPHLPPSLERIQTILSKGLRSHFVDGGKGVDVEDLDDALCLALSDALSNKTLPELDNKPIIRKHFTDIGPFKAKIKLRSEERFHETDRANKAEDRIAELEKVIKRSRDMIGVGEVFGILDDALKQKGGE